MSSGAEAFGIGLKADQDAVAHDVARQAFHVVRASRNRGRRAGRGLVRLAPARWWRGGWRRARAGAPAAARTPRGRGSARTRSTMYSLMAGAILIEAARARNARTSVGPNSGGSSVVRVSESGRGVSETLGRSSILSSAARSG